MSTDQDNLSPVLDVNRCNLITASSRMDNPDGTEDRFGAISQTLTVSTSSDFVVSSVSPDVVSAAKFAITGVTGGSFTNTIDSATRLTQAGSGASGQIVNVTADSLELIDITGTFVAGNPVAQGGTSANLTSTTIKTGIVIGWDSGTGQLKVKVISDNLFEVNDRIDDTEAGTAPVTNRLITAVSDSTGFLFVDENTFNSSSASKYLTKEVTLDSPATALDCKITAIYLLMKMSKFCLRFVQMEVLKTLLILDGSISMVLVFLISTQAFYQSNLNHYHHLLKI